MNKNEIIDRCLAIEQEYDSLYNIHLSSEDYEDASDRYQAKLELSWHKDELCNEYERLNMQLGYADRMLYPKDARRKPQTSSLVMHNDGIARHEDFEWSIGE